jgi:hypothetical protein
VENFSIPMNYDVAGIDYDYVCHPAFRIAGGAVVSWRRDLWAASQASVRRFSITMLFTPLSGPGKPCGSRTSTDRHPRGDKQAFL